MKRFSHALYPELLNFDHKPFYCTILYYCYFFLIIVISFVNILVDYWIVNSLLPIFNITMKTFLLKVIAFDTESNVNWESTLWSK